MRVRTYVYDYLKFVTYANLWTGQAVAARIERRDAGCSTQHRRSETELVRRSFSEWDAYECAMERKSARSLLGGVRSPPKNSCKGRPFTEFSLPINVVPPKRTEGAAKENGNNAVKVRRELTRILPACSSVFDNRREGSRKGYEPPSSNSA